MSKMTGWFPTSVKPVREGVYEVEPVISGYKYCNWNGTRWGWAATTVQLAERFNSTDGAWQHKKWRGLASDPSKGKK